MKLIKNGNIILEDKVVFNKALVFNEKIVDIIDENYIDNYMQKNKIPESEIIDARGNYISPGLIDIHVHGSGGSDAMDGTVEAISVISQNLCKNGVTAFLPTTMTMSKIKIYKALDAIKESMNIKFKGARVLGAHMEGPFVNVKYKGAQNEKYILNADYSFIEDYIDTIKIITLAPEMDEYYEFIKQVKRNTNIVVSIGHTNAYYEEAIEAIEMGASHITHMFNAMTPLHHRNPGVVGAAFNAPVTCELIADNIHVHSAVFNMLIKVKGADKVALITDSMRAGNLDEGEYEFGGQNVIVKHNSARLPDGTLAGSILKLNDAVKNVFNETNLKLHQVIAMASINSARIINIQDKKGSIAIGKDADIVIFDKEFNINATIVEGNVVFRN